MPDLDPSFLALPAGQLADAALGRARELGAEHADFRLERIRTGVLRLRDAKLDTSVDSEDFGLAVRVIHDGAWGFASGIERTPDAARRLAEQAVAAAKVSRVLSDDPVTLAPEPVYADATWLSSYQVNPFDIDDGERVARLADLSERLLSADGVDHVDAMLMQVLENKYYADTAGTSTTQQRVRVHPQFTAVHVDRGAGKFYSMRTVAPPVGRGWEYLTGTGWDFDAEIAELPDLLAEHVKAPSVEAGQFDIVRDGTLVGFQLNRQMAQAKGFGRSNGCAFGDSPGHIPLQRMANVSLQAAPGGPSTAELISGVDRGIYIVGDRSWSIDMQRYNFQFTGQRFYRIENGRLAGQLRDVAYQATTTDFWGSMEAAGGPGTHLLAGTFTCGKGQPGQGAPVSHGAPAALFRGVRILNTLKEAGR